MFVPYTEETFEVANSYLSVEEADELLAGQLDTESWNGLEPSVKQVLLQQSSLAVDGALTYKGVKVSDNQILKFPRMKLDEDVDEASKVLPMNIKFAVITLCKQYSNDKAFKNITSETISKLSWDFQSSDNEIGAEVLAFLKPLKATSVKIGSSNEY